MVFGNEENFISRVNKDGLKNAQKVKDILLKQLYGGIKEHLRG